MGKIRYSTGRIKDPVRQDENMPSMWHYNENQVMAILASDWHLWHSPPIARGENREEWYEAMGRPIMEIKSLCYKHNCPLIIAGDIFDKWNAPAELINWLIPRLPLNTYAIPGQHDLPFHRLDEIKRTAFWTLVEAGAINYLEPHKPTELDNLVLWGFPWGVEVTPCPPKHLLDTRDHIAIIHAYAWKSDYCYPGAPEEYRLKYWRKKLQGYDAAVFGDNHISWST